MNIYSLNIFIILYCNAFFKFYFKRLCIIMDHFSLMELAAIFFKFIFGEKILKSGYKVIGIDNVNSYYYKNFKLKRCLDNNFYF